MGRLPDPRATRRYRNARKAFIAQHIPGSPCCLCGHPIDTTLPGNVPAGPTVEHRIPVRRLRLMVGTTPELQALVCDTSTWGLAHRRCQDKQGGRASRETQGQRMLRPEREW